MTTPTHLDPSELGTKSYWDAAYERELSNFSTNADDEGTIWFSDSSAEERMLAYLENLSDEGVLHKESAHASSSAGKDTEGEPQASDGQNEEFGQAATRFLDLGTGNGHLLFALREEEWQGEMVGVDYSAQSVKLAREICSSKGGEYTDISFHEWNILTQSPGDWLGSEFDVVLDKGTFDAISLSEEKDANGRRICEGYREKVEQLVKRGGRFLITSCNWTEEELKSWFEVLHGKMVYEDKVKYPSYTFGGKTGSSVVTLCFKRKT